MFKTQKQWEEETKGIKAQRNWLAVILIIFFLGMLHFVDLLYKLSTIIR
jgi:hypothetical protein